MLILLLYIKVKWYQLVIRMVRMIIRSRLLVIEIVLYISRLIVLSLEFNIDPITRFMPTPIEIPPPTCSKVVPRAMPIPGKVENRL